MCEESYFPWKKEDSCEKKKLYFEKISEKKKILYAREKKKRPILWKKERSITNQKIKDTCSQSKIKEK